MQTLSDHWLHLLFTGTIYSVSTAREKQATLASLQFYLQPTASHLFPSGPRGTHPCSAILTVVALGLGGLAFPLLPVLLPLFISDLSFCSLMGKNNTDNARYVIQTQTLCHTQTTDRRQNKGRRWGGSPVAIAPVRAGLVLRMRVVPLLPDFSLFLVSWLFNFETIQKAQTQLPIPVKPIQ